MGVAAFRLNKASKALGSRATLGPSWGAYGIVSAVPQCYRWVDATSCIGYHKAFDKI